MSERKIVVPEGMLKAAKKSVVDAQMHRLPVDRPWDLACLPLEEIILEAALLWLSENPIVPTNEQTQGVCDSIFVGPENLLDPRDAMVEWQRRMFLAPEPEVPEEIANLLWGDWHKNARPDLVEPRTGFAPFESHNAQVLEAYRRGLRGSLKDKWEEFFKESKEKP